MNTKTKKKGPIRIEAIVPFTIVVALIAAYFILFFDSHLRKGLEWGATYANGAEVNIGSLKTSFFKASMNIRGIEVTDAATPTKNKVQIGEVRFQLLWDALLRAKFVISDAALLGIDLGTPRKKPGRVLPPPSDKPSLFAKAKEEVSRAVLAEAGDLLDGLDPSQKIKDLKNLKSAARLDELKGQLAKKETEWSQVLNSLPGQKDFAALQERINGIQPGDIKSPAEIPAKVNQVKSLIGETETKVTAIKTQGDHLMADVNGFSASIAQVDDLVKQDRLDLEKMLKIPSLDAKSLAKQLFGAAAMGKIQQGERYISMARQYMPPKKPKEKVVVQRAKGKLYQFGRPNAYPLFWLKKAQVSSQGVEGKILDVTSDPPMLGRPTLITLKGDFPKQNIYGFSAVVTLDHTKEIATETIKAAVASYPVGNMVLSDSEGFKLAFVKATGTAGVEASLSGDQIRLQLTNSFQKIEPSISAKSKLLQETVSAVLRGIPVVDARVGVTGTWSDPSLSIESNLATALQSGLEKQLQAKLAEARKKLDAMIQANIGKRKAELTDKFNATRTKYTSQIEEKKKQAEALKSQATAKLDAVKKQGAGAQKKATDMIKKKLPFGR